MMHVILILLAPGLVSIVPGILSCGACLWRSWFSISFLFFAAMAPSFAGVNSWTKPTSGYWEEQAYWSLGAWPDASQDVVFTNAGWKALAIGYGTRRTFRSP